MMIYVILVCDCTIEDEVLTMITHALKKKGSFESEIDGTFILLLLDNMFALLTGQR